MTVSVACDEPKKRKQTASEQRRNRAISLALRNGKFKVKVTLPPVSDRKDKQE